MNDYVKLDSIEMAYSEVCKGRMEHEQENKIFSHNPSVILNYDFEF